MGVVGIGVSGVLGMLAILMAVEFIHPARRFEEVRGWRLKCVAFIPMILVISTAIPLLLSELMVGLQLLPGDRLGLVGGALVGIFLSEFIVYWVHRLHHSVDFLWRWIHQLHHSAERMDVFGAAYFHPFEIIEGTVVGVLFFSVVLGLTPEAAALAILWQAFNGIFQHGNIRTPTWLGYIIQRPEAHGVHHERGVHGSNYANLALWDLIFGTFKSPASWEGLAGFYSGSSQPTLEMLLGHDISREGPSA